MRYKKSCSELMKTNFDIINSIDLPPEVIKICRGMFTVRKKDPGYSPQRLGARLAADELICWLALQRQKNKSVSEQSIRKKVDTLIKRFSLFREWFEDDLVRVGTLMMPVVKSSGIQSVKKENVIGLRKREYLIEVNGVYKAKKIGS